MADVTLTIGNRRHSVACPDGQEPDLHRLGTMVDARWSAAMRASGGLSGERTMLFVALMLADALHDAGRMPKRAPDDDDAQTARIAERAAFARIADRLEALANRLEQ